MKIKLIAIGKEDAELFDPPLKQYVKKINFYNTFEIITIPYLKNTNNLSFNEQKKREGELILKKITPSDYVVLLDEKGKNLSSVEFSKFIMQQANSGLKNLIFIIGGAYGFSEEVYQRQNYALSLSKMTFPHLMTRLIFAEQLYRAYTILKNEPYHHE